MSLAYDVIPVTLVTGFLGSGKSTLLVDVLTGEAARDTAVLVNEFGEVGLDHLLMGELESQTVLLENGCVCCSIRGELKDALTLLFSRRARGDLPPFSRVVIETTGLATPAPIVATLLADAIVRSHFVLSTVIAVVDAVNADEQKTRYPEWLAQVSAADRIVISKGDMTGARHVDSLKTSLQILNPLATIDVRNSSPDALRELLFAPARFASNSVQSIGRIGASAARPVRLREAGGGELPTHRSVVGPSSIVSSSMCINDPLDWQVFTLWLTLLLNRHGDKILRMKGLLSIKGADRPAVVHAIQHLVHPVLHLEKWPDGSRMSRLVFISEGLDGAAIETSYYRFNVALGDRRSGR
ncbi:CobW family GTP-binding protein [Paraburkholderia sp. SIMBA_054]|uniref:CobW family GTP-binding protein n=1 Tax=Paraburkholderia sp. SIMBA_054 TaxID=3085795 RepID=UPI00397C5F78